METIVTTTGRIIRTGDGRSGLIVMDETNTHEILTIDEVSDDKIVHVFLTAPQDTSGIVERQYKDLDYQEHQYEILKNI